MHMPPNSGGGNFEPPPAGTHRAICYRVIDLGTQQSEYQGQTKHQRKIMLSWELVDERMPASGDYPERPFTIHQRYTLSGQFLGLQLFGRARWREQFGGCIVNLVSWGSSPRYARRQVESSPHALSGFTDVVSEAHALIERYKGLDPWQYPKALNEQVCLSAYGKCAGWDFCRFGKAAVRKSSS